MTGGRAIANPLQRLLPIVVPLVAIWVISGCATLDRIIKKPTADFAGFQFTNASLLQAQAVLNFNVTNPNPINIRASRITYDLKINGRNFMAGELDQGVTLIGGSTSTLSIPVSIRYLDFFESLTQLWQAEDVDYALFGGFSVGPVRIPLKAHGSFDLPKMPKMSLESIQIEDFSLDGAKLNCRLKLTNPNAFDLLFKRLEYHLNLGGTSIAHASAMIQDPIASRHTSVLNFGADVSFAQLGQSLYQLLNKDKGDFLLTGSMVMNSPTGKEQIVPFEIDGRVPFKR